MVQSLTEVYTNINEVYVKLTSNQIKSQNIIIAALALVIFAAVVAVSMVKRANGSSETKTRAPVGTVTKISTDEQIKERKKVGHVHSEIMKSLKGNEISLEELYKKFNDNEALDKEAVNNYMKIYYPEFLIKTP